MTSNKNHPLQKIDRGTLRKWQAKLEEATGRPIAGGKASIGSVFLLLDCSGSMSAGNKLANAKRGGIEYATDAIQLGYNVGIISFGDTAKIILNPQGSPTTFEQSITKILLEGSTNLTAALEIARKGLCMESGKRVIFVVTDGFPDDPDTALQEARAAADDGIEIMALGTDDANIEFLNSLSVSEGHSQKVNRSALEQSIKTMAKLLTAPKRYK